MKPIRTEAVMKAIEVMAEARGVLARSRDPGHFEMATKVAMAEGALRAGLQEALPKTIEVAT